MAAEIQGGSCLGWRSPGDVAALPARQGVSECLPGGTLGWGEGVCLSVCLSAGARGELCPPVSLPRPTVPHRALHSMLNPFQQVEPGFRISRDPSWKRCAAPWACQGTPKRTHPPPHGLGYLAFPSTAASRCCRHPKALPCGRGTAWGGRRAPAESHCACQPGGTALPASGTVLGHQESRSRPGEPFSGAPWRCFPPYLVLARSIYRGRAFCSGRKHPPARPHPAGTGQDGLGGLPATQQRPSC